MNIIFECANICKHDSAKSRSVFSYSIISENRCVGNGKNTLRTCVFSPFSDISVLKDKTALRQFINFCADRLPGCLIQHCDFFMRHGYIECLTVPVDPVGE